MTKASMKKFFLVFVLALSAGVSAAAQEYAIEVLPDKKVINVGLMNLPPDASVNTLLQMIPDLLERGDQLFSNYDIQYDGKSVGESRSEILYHTRLYELDKIEIFDSAIETQQKNARSGVIDLKPKPLADGLGGEASLAASTVFDILPGANVNYSNDKFSMRSYANFEYYDATFTQWFENTGKDIVTKGTEDNACRYLQETARVNLEYRFDADKTLKGWLLESFSRENDGTFTDKSIMEDKSAQMGAGWWYETKAADTLLTRTKTLLLNAMAEYEQKFSPDAKLTVFAGFSSRSSRQDGRISDPGGLENIVKYEWMPARNDRFTLKAIVGVNTNLGISSSTALFSRKFEVSPYGTLKYSSEHWKINFTARYKHLVRNLKVEGTPIPASRDNDMEVDLRAVWQMKPHHALKFSLSRTMVRPEDWMLYPGLYFNSEKKIWVMGKPDLQKSYFHTAGVEYIFDHRHGDSYFVLNSSIEYGRADGIIEQYSDYSDKGRYIAFRNSGVNNILKGLASLNFNYKILSVTFGGNVFANFYTRGGMPYRNVSFNLCLTPVLNFKKGWVFSANALYNSPVSRNDEILGESFCLQLKLDKRWDSWSVGVELNDVFDYLSSDITKKVDETNVLSHDLFPRYLGASLTYHFGNLSRK